MKVRSLSFAILLALLLVFAQQAGAIHALSHFAKSEQDQQEKHLPGAKACEKCAVFAKLGSALHSSEATFCLPQPTQHLTCVSPVSFEEVGSVPYHSRAPPHLS